MKRTELLKLLRESGCVLLREGRRHSIYLHVADGKFTPVPRHREINEWTAKKILRDLGVEK